MLIALNKYAINEEMSLQKNIKLNRGNRTFKKQTSDSFICCLTDSIRIQVQVRKVGTQRRKNQLQGEGGQIEKQRLIRRRAQCTIDISFRSTNRGLGGHYECSETNNYHVVRTIFQQLDNVHWQVNNIYQNGGRSPIQSYECGNFGHIAAKCLTRSY